MSSPKSLIDLVADQDVGFQTETLPRAGTVSRQAPGTAKVGAEQSDVEQGCVAAAPSGGAWAEAAWPKCACRAPWSLVIAHPHPEVVRVVVCKSLVWRAVMACW